MRLFDVKLLLVLILSVISSNQAKAEIRLNGNGIPEGYAVGCVPTSLNDFMETVSYSIRRVEPRECDLINISTPIFSWPIPADLPDAGLMTFRLVKVNADNTTTAITALSTATPRVLHSKELVAGNYKWHVTYTNKYGQLITGQQRRFSVKSGTLFPIPSGTALADKVAGKTVRPRTLPAGSSFASLATKAQNSDYKEAYKAFLEKADSYLIDTVTAVPANLKPENFSTSTLYDDWFKKVIAASIVETTAVETLGYALQFTSNSKYQARALSRLMNLAAWPVDGATSEAKQDQANRRIYLALALGLDLHQNRLSPAQRTTIVNALRNRLSQTMAKFDKFATVPYDSHLLTATQFTTEALMAAVGTPEFTEAKSLLAKSWETMITMSGAWGGGSDGGFGNGSAYGWFAMNNTARLMAAVRLMANVNLSLWSALGNIGQNQIALTPAAGYLMGSMGDGVETNRNYFDYSWQEFRLLANVTGKPEYEWYWRVDPRNTLLHVSLLPYHFMMLGLTTPQAPAQTPVLPDSYLFEDAGYVAIHSKTTDTLRSSLVFRSSRLGSYNHSHADNNGFTFVSKGKEILISGGYYPDYLTAHHAKVNRATRYKNALTFDSGIGQSEPSPDPIVPGAPVMSMDANGKLINFKDNGTWAVATGDATKAYSGYDSSKYTWTPLLTNAVRTVAYNRKEKVVVIYDYATSLTPRKWELNFQALTEPVLNGTTIQITNGTSKGCINIYAPAGYINLSSGFTVAPEKPAPNQFRAIYKVLNASGSIAAITTIREDCRVVPITVQFSGTSASISINSQPALTMDRRMVVLP